MNDTPKPDIQKPDTVIREEKILTFWKEQNIFEKSLKKDAPRGEFTFYDGPPFATGVPHIGHLLASAIKDAVGRYRTMQGYHVRRVWGWDCHGLPVETIVEEKLGLKTKKDIEEIGVARFNAEARAAVLAFVREWKRYIERIGRWVDFDNAYKTMDTDYMESVWWALKTLHEHGDLYEGNRVLMYCPRCETPLAKAEIAMDNSYKDVTDIAITVAFRAKTLPNTSFLAWTTTPWTLPGNVALAVHPDLQYVTVEKKEKGAASPERFIVARELLERVFGEREYTVVAEQRGSELVGLSYEPVYEITKPEAQKQKFENAYKVYAADFVTAEEGTGIVHTAVMYGEDDYELGRCEGLPQVQMLQSNGTYNDVVPKFLRGQYLKDTEKEIIEDLSSRALLFAQAPHTHSYPHCYRCGTPLIYNAVPSWFIDIQKHKDRILELNEEINWVPGHLKEGRFKNILKSAPDWTISRNRYWATPLPIWRGKNSGKLLVIGSIEELAARTASGHNTYFAIRHGESKSNVANVINTSGSKEADNLTEHGRAEVLAQIGKIREEGSVDLIFTSPLTRTRETADLLAEGLGVPPERVILEDRLREIDAGVFDGEPLEKYRAFYKTYEERFTTAPEGAETLNDLRQRVGALLYDLEARYSGKRILLVSHERTIWALSVVARGLTAQDAMKTPETGNAEVTSLAFLPLPHNEQYELDLHRPYIDDVKIIGADEEPYQRVKEVVDCWVESGSMPFAELHYPIENDVLFSERLPADFIAEYIAQTRTWFYYLHTLSIILFDKPAFTNVVTTGTILTASGEKMSKSKRNFTDPLINIDKYGADALRIYLLGSVIMQAEDLMFKDEDLREAHNRVVALFINSTKFYELFVQERVEAMAPPNVLDKWMEARVEETIQAVTGSLEAYESPRALRALRVLVEDISQWYVRRSRDRMRTGAPTERARALKTLRDTLRTTALLFAPFAPFLAEEVFQTTKYDLDPESVHLAPWPTSPPVTFSRMCARFVGRGEQRLVATMARVRALASEALKERQTAGIKVRQPLATLSVPDSLPTEFASVLAEEVNVKKIKTRAPALALDTELTPSLVREGDVREFTRALASARKARGLSQHDTVRVSIVKDAESLLAGAVIPGVSKISFNAPKDAQYVATLSFGDISFSIENETNKC